MSKDFDTEGYKAKLECYLEGLGPNLSVELDPHPSHWIMTSNGQVSEGNDYFIYIQVISSKISPDGAEVIIQRHEDELDNPDYRVWRDAFVIQEEYYKTNSIERGSPSEGSPYWKLWDYLEKPAS